MKAKKTSRSNRSYVVKRDGAYRINGTRVSLDSIVYAFRDGQSPESILISFPVLTLEQIYGAGLIVIPQPLAISASANDLILMWSASKAEEWVNKITFLPL